MASDDPHSATDPSRAAAPPAGRLGASGTERTAPWQWPAWLESQALAARRAGARTLAAFRLGDLGLVGWVAVLFTTIIIAGLAALAWMAWSFNDGANRDLAAREGLVAVSPDFDRALGKPDDVLFRVAGAMSAGTDLAAPLAEAWMRARGYSGVSSRRDGRVIAVSGSKDGQRVRILVALGSAHGGFLALSQDRVEAVVAERQIAPSEADLLSAYGDMTRPQSEHVIALDAWRVLVNRARGGESIQPDVLGRILAGEIRDWRDTGLGDAGPISVKLEATGADMPFSLPGRLLGDRELAASVETAERADIPAAVAADPLAIGLTRAPEGTARALAVQERNARLVAPADMDIATETYAFVERAHIYVPSSRGNPAARDFAAFAASADGQAIVLRAGRVPLRVAAVRIRPPAGAPAAYAAFTQTAERLNFDIRFAQGANDPDARAAADIARLAAWAKAGRVEGRRIALLAFADNVGARATNLGLAQSRAEAVAAQMEKQGLSPGLVRAFGDAMPVGANAEERGRIRNRRVEVWVCPPPACPALELAAGAGDAPAQDRSSLPAGVRLGPPPRPATPADAPKG